LNEPHDETIIADPRGQLSPSQVIEKRLAKRGIFGIINFGSRLAGRGPFSRGANSRPEYADHKAPRAASVARQLGLARRRTAPNGRWPARRLIIRPGGRPACGRGWICWPRVRGCKEENVLVLTRKAGERIVIGPSKKNTTVTIVRMKQGGERVVVGVDADPATTVHREEVAERIAAEAARSEVA
jgi:carbon storage regulator CsrA